MEGVRDGAGGGFNERQERASAAASLVVGEDGFDDFGRRIDKGGLFLSQFIYSNL